MRRQKHRNEAPKRGFAYRKKSVAGWKQTQKHLRLRRGGGERSGPGNSEGKSLPEFKTKARSRGEVDARGRGCCFEEQKRVFLHEGKPDP